MAMVTWALRFPNRSLQWVTIIYIQSKSENYVPFQIFACNPKLKNLGRVFAAQLSAKSAAQFDRFVVLDNNI